ncbi:Cytochrome b6 [Glycine soja]
MTFYYRPIVTEAFASVQYIMTEANFGWLIRSVHRWSASVMVLMMILHVFRVYLTGGFKKPRELTWVTGVVLAVLTASFGVTGYSLPWDQIGYWAVKIVTGVPDAIPVIGSSLVELLRGSSSVGQSTLTRNELSSSLAYSTQAELKSSKVWLGSAHFHPYMQGRARCKTN